MVSRRKKVKKSRLPKLMIIFFVFAFLLGIFFRAKIWRSEAKLILAVNRPDEAVSVLVFDPKAKEITNIVIPKNTEVEVSRGLGKWKLKSIWALGQNEKIGGRLLSETIRKNFRTPVNAWADQKAEGLIRPNFFRLLISTLSPYKTNLSLADKIRLFTFSLTVKEFKRTEINLAETSFLTKSRLIDGEEGYLITNKYPQKLLVIFSDAIFSSGNFKVAIANASENGKIGENVAEIIEVMGAKVAMIVNQESKDADCRVSGQDKKAVKSVSLVFGCEEAKDVLSDSNFDIEIELGEKFSKRF